MTAFFTTTPLMIILKKAKKSKKKERRGKRFFYWLERDRIMIMIDGRSNTTKMEGKIKITIGKIILTGALRA